MDAYDPDLVDITPGAPDWEQSHDRGASHAFVFGASCPALAAWGASVGFDVLLLGVALDPLGAVRELCDRDHGRGGMTMDVVQASPECWTDWVLEPISGGIWASSHVRPWGGVLRIDLGATTPINVFAGRLAAALSPLEAIRQASAPRSASARCTRGSLPPAMPRFTLTPDGWLPVRGLYRWSTAGDRVYASRAILAAMGCLGSANAVLDMLADGERALDAPAVWT